MNEEAKPMGKVYLVGAGPGDPGLITLKGIQCIQQADVILYDYLASEELLRYAAPGAEIIYVGKQASNFQTDQKIINQKMIEGARSGKIVTRLKGGDPFVFGRGGEEAEVLAEAGIPFEIVPGVTSAIAVPAYAGIPVTHRSYSSMVTILTGHESSHKSEFQIDWSLLAREGQTLVILMGLRNLPYIVKQLLEYGKPPQTPVALIEWGTVAEQKVAIGNLQNIVEKAVEQNFKPPTTIIIGEVVQLHKKLNWFGKT
ncbi:MAG TPA: uroporphyrinogen-III C-methyltransferase [Candidatus Limnocylindrales bacterium]|nr:uroporphyrinogen-III C-methyltransferase [Candidatus Limnocylindrales bacterium]